MSKFEVGQKWRMRNGHVVTVVYQNSSDIVVQRENLSLCLLHSNGCVLPQGGPMWEDLIEQVVEPKYRPFANAAEYEPHRSKWVQRQRDSGWSGNCLVVAYDDEGIDLCTYDGTWQAAFENLRFEDGTPFGVRVS